MAAVTLLAAYALLIRPGLEQSSARDGAAVIERVHASEPESGTDPAQATGAMAAEVARPVRAERLIVCIERAEGHFATIDRCHNTFAAAR